MGRKVGTGQTGQMQDWKNECVNVYVILNIKYQTSNIKYTMQKSNIFKRLQYFTISDKSC